MQTTVVVDTESDETTRTVLGEFSHTEEDSVAYWEWETGLLAWAPYDCVEIVPGRIAFRGPGGLVEAA